MSRRALWGAVAALAGVMLWSEWRHARRYNVAPFSAQSAALREQDRGVLM